MSFSDVVLSHDPSKASKRHGVGLEMAKVSFERIRNTARLETRSTSRLDRASLLGDVGLHTII